MPENAETTQPEKVAATEKPRDTDRFEPITSQEELDRIIQKRVARVQEKFSDYDELSAAAARANEQSANWEKLVAEATGRAETAETRLRDAELARERLQVVIDYQVRPEAREFLTATTVEGLQEQAEKLSKLVPRGHSTIPDSAAVSIPNSAPKDAGAVFGAWAKRQ